MEKHDNIVKLKNYKLHENIVVDGIKAMFFYNYTNNFINEEITHDAWELHYQNNGNATIVNNNNYNKISQAQAFLHKPFSHHRYISQNEFSSAGIIIFNSRSKILEEIADKIINFNHDESILFSNIINEGETLYKQNPSNFWFNNRQKNIICKPQYAVEQIIKNSLELLLINIIRNQFINNETKEPKKEIDFTKFSLVDSIIKYLKDNFMYPFSLQDLSKKMSYNSNYLCRVFKKHMGCSIITYLTKIRIFEAQKLLAKNYSIQYVSDITGFSSVQYFSTQFKKYTQITPAQFKKSAIMSNLIDNTFFKL